METENPYRAPQGDGLEDITSKEKAERPVYNNRWQASRAGMRRGAVLGLKISTIVSAILFVILLLVIIALMIMRAGYILSSAEMLSKFAIDTVKMFGGLFAVWVLLIIYISVPCGIIMGLIEAIRFRKPK